MGIFAQLDSLRSKNSSRRKARTWLGFTLLELMIVITILLILMTLAAGRYEQSVRHAKEAALHQDLRVLREAIDQYTLDKQAAPQSLDDLVSAEYLRSVPVDPVTRAKDWNVTIEDVVLSPEQTTTGITDVHSSSPLVSPFENTPYNTW